MSRIAIFPIADENSTRIHFEITGFQLIHLNTPKIGVSTMSFRAFGTYKKLKGKTRVFFTHLVFKITHISLKIARKTINIFEKNIHNMH